MIDTLPLDAYPASNKKATITTVIDSKYRDSLQLKVDVYPAGMNAAESHDHWIEVWGRWPHYQVRLSITFASRRLGAAIRWPDDDDLHL